MRVSLINVFIIVGTLIVALVATLIAARIARWRRDVALRRHAAPVLVMPISTASTSPRSLLAHDFRARRPSPSTVRRLTPREEIIIEPEVDDDVILVGNDAMVERVTTPLRTVGDVANLSDDIQGASMVRGGHVRYHRAEEGTLEFLPGRLQIVSGGDVGQEIHFLRQVGEEDATITFGRSDGPPLRHVQLLDPTVSRNHARLAYTGGRWHLTNLSQTNPVSLNGSALPPSGRPMTLAEGDRVEMGAVVFIFHDR